MELVCIKCGAEKPATDFLHGTCRNYQKRKHAKRCRECRAEAVQRRKDAAANGLRICSQCGCQKPPELFTKHMRRTGGRASGLDSRCLQCSADAQEARRRAAGKKQHRRRSAIGTEKAGFVCCTCKQLKPATEYKKNRDLWDYRCKECQRKRATASWQKHRFRYSVKVAARRSIAWDLTPDQFAELADKPCHYCGFPLPLNGIGLDRLDSLIHYTVSNVVPCCTECNMAKGAFFSVEEMLVLGKTIAAIKQARLENGVPPNSYAMGAMPRRS